jgi:hypothetical protein
VNRKKKRPNTVPHIAFFVLFFLLFLTPSKAVLCQEALIRLKVVADQANIRLEPDISSIIIRQVPKGTILNAKAKKEEWFAVQLTSKQGAEVTGYVHESLVTAMDPVPEDKTPIIVPKTQPVEPQEDQPQSPPRFTLSITAGGNYLHGGDFNLGIIGFSDLTEDILGIQGEGNIDPVHWGYVIGIETSFSISPTLFWGIGIEHFQASNESQMDYSLGATSTTLIVQPNINATPVSVFLSYNPVPRLYVKGGISYYFAGCSYTYLFHADDLTAQRMGKANGHGLGVMGGIGFLNSLSSSLSFVVEITGRLAKLQGFSGEEEFQDFTGSTGTEEGTLYLAQVQVLEERTHSVLFIRETRPNEAGIISAKEAQIDLSGLSLKIGLRFHF